MATSAFKSTSRRDAAAAAAETRAPRSTLRRRSHSVSAVSRKVHSHLVDKTQIPSEFSNSRDNPLFWAASSPSPDREESGKVSETAVSTNRQAYASNSCSSRNENGNCGSISEQRGRSVTREISQKEGVDRSLSRVRGRSVSRPGGAYEHGNDRATIASSIAQRRKENRKSGNGVRRTNSVGGGVDMQFRTMNAGCQVSEWSEDDSVCSMRISNVEDGISIGSLSEVEEKAVRGASNKLHVFQRNNLNIFTTSNASNKPSDFVNPEAVELFSEIRREYAIKLEESEERTRKLRADLATEERLGKELDRILKEMLHDTNTPAVPRSRRRRRASNERNEMSKCLAEEAMAYFDECVSLSTFDSSDLSASEDQPIGASSLGNKDLNHKQMYGEQARLYGHEGSSITTDGCSFEPQTTQRYNLSFVDKKWEPKENIMSYIKSFEKKDVDFEASSSYYDAGEYQCESLLIDRVLFKDRMESGGLLLCSFLPFT